MLERLFSKPVSPYFEKPADPTNIIRRAELTAETIQNSFQRGRDIFSKPGKRDFFALFMQRELVQRDPELTESPSLQNEIDAVFSQRLRELRKKMDLLTISDETFYKIVKPLHIAAIFSITLFNTHNGIIDNQLQRQLRDNYARAANKYDAAFHTTNNTSTTQE